jgi:hypothetical protein
MNPRSILRIEGLTVIVLSLSAYYTLDGPLWLFVLLILAPDLSMLWYLAGSRVGGLIYNIAHTYSVPLGLAGIGLLGGYHLAYLVALIWIIHIGADRLFGYGLKFDSGFNETHLSPQLYRNEFTTTENAGSTTSGGRE